MLSDIFHSKGREQQFWFNWNVENKNTLRFLLWGLLSKAKLWLEARGCSRELKEGELSLFVLESKCEPGNPEDTLPSPLLLLPFALSVKFVPSLALKPTSLRLWCVLQSSWDIQPRGLSNCWILGFLVGRQPFFGLSGPQPISQSTTNHIYVKFVYKPL